VRSKLARLAMAVAMVLGVLVTFATADAGAASAPITIVLITSRTGVAAAEYSTAPAGFLARVALQNASGGIDGHKIVPLVIDDQTSLSSVATATQDAISKKALGIVAVSPVFFCCREIPARSRDSGHRKLLRRPRMGRAALYEHVRIRQWQR